MFGSVIDIERGECVHSQDLLSLLGVGIYKPQATSKSTVLVELVRVLCKLDSKP